MVEFIMIIIHIPISGLFVASAIIPPIIVPGNRIATTILSQKPKKNSIEYLSRDSFL